MSEDINPIKASPEHLDGIRSAKPGRFTSKVAPVPHNPQPLDDATRQAHAIDPYAGIILPVDADSKPAKPTPLAPKPKEPQEPESHE